MQKSLHILCFISANLGKLSCHAKPVGMFCAVHGCSQAEGRQIPFDYFGKPKYLCGI
ncbi:MAG: hypothetical protein K6F98_02540 [Bacteroidales bacterium]|nr:hypothetical protein [Bacteroidales bacterium]